MSSWPSWPLLVRPIWYQFDKIADERFQAVIFLGNPLILWPALAALGICLRDWIVTRRADAFLILALYLGPWLAWATLPRTIGFIYYYLPSATIATLALVYALTHGERAPPRWVLWAFVAAASLGFAAMLPISVAMLGTSMQTYQRLMIFQSWGLLYAILQALITALQMNSVNAVLGGNGVLNAFIGSSQMILLGAVSVLFSIAIALIPFLASRLVRGDVGNTVFALALELCGIDELAVLLASGLLALALRWWSQPGRPRLGLLSAAIPGLPTSWCRTGRCPCCCATSRPGTCRKHGSPGSSTIPNSCSRTA